MDQSKRNISDISHHFLSNVRGGETPRRTPPGGQTPPTTEPVSEPESAEAERAVDADTPQEQPAYGEQDPIGRPVTAVIGAGLNGSFFTRCREFAAHLCRDGGRVGLLQVDAAEFRLHLIEHDPSPAELPPLRGRPIEGRMESRRIRESLHELDYDVDQWLLVLPDPRRPEAAQLLQLVDSWTLLTTADHEGVVAGYRALKGLLNKNTPAIRLAMLDATGEADACRVFAKLDGVCRQFLDAGLEGFGRVAKSEHVSEHSILWLRGIGGIGEPPVEPTGAMATPVQWNVVRNFLSRNRAVLDHDEHIAEAVEAMIPQEAAEEEVEQTMEASPSPHHEEPVAAPVAAPVAPAPTAPTAPTAPAPIAEPIPVPTPAMKLPVVTADDDAELVVDLPPGGDVVTAVLQARTDLIGCKLNVPGAVGQIAVRRDGRLVLLSVADESLADLETHASAMHWLNQSAALIAQALPQMAIRVDMQPVLMLLIGHRRADASVLQPLVAAGKVELLPYRKVKWGERHGLLLAA